MPEPGTKAPAFRLPALPDGKPVRLSEFQGKWVVLYFYPRDMTPGCTTEACEFRDTFDSLQQGNVVVLGVSTDSVARHQKFAEKYDLPFPLLADEEHEIAEKYGVWKQKINFGKKYFGMQRATFLIDPQGKIAHVWPRVKVSGHVQAVREKLAELQ